MCVIITPYDKYKHKHSPLDFKYAPDFVQQVMEQVQQWLDNVKDYLDEIGIFTNTWEEHLLVIILSDLEAMASLLTPSSANGESKKL